MTTHILPAVCRAMKITEAEVLGNGRHPEVVKCREYVWWHLRATGMSFPEVARASGRPNHSTVITGLDRFKPDPAILELTTVAVEAASIQADAEAKRIRSEREQQGATIMDIATQRKIAQVKAETPFAGSETPFAGSAKAFGPNKTTAKATKAPTPHIESTAVTLSRCPKCGLRQFHRTDIQDANGRYRWECRRLDPVCGWVAYGR